MLKHVTLINPPQVYTKYQVTAGIVPPLGILYLAAYLNKHDIGVSVIDSTGSGYDTYSRYRNVILRGLGIEEILERIPARTDLIGISALYSPAHLLIKELIDAVRKRFPSKVIAVGGAHATVLPEFILKETTADIAVIGEGELTLLDLCRRPADLSEIDGIVYKKGGKIFFNRRRALIEDLDELPFPDRRLIELENYFNAAEPHGCSASGLWTTILSSRGCPYDCSFCTTPEIWQRRWRKRAVENVLREMDELNRGHGIIDFHFEDENMGFDKEWLRAFCDSLIEKNAKFTWQPSNGLRVETVLYPGLMNKIKDSGCSLVVFSLESASERVRNQIIKKKLDINDIEKAVSLANKSGIRSTCYFIIGLPGERRDEAHQTMRYISHLARRGLDECVIALFSLLPGCELFNNLYKAGKVKLNSDFFRQLLAMGDLSVFKSWNDNISDKELKALRLHGYLMFILYKALFSPFKITRTMLNIVTGRDQLKSERVIRTFIRRSLAPHSCEKGRPRNVMADSGTALGREKAYHDKLASDESISDIDVGVYFEGPTAPETRYMLSRLGDLSGKRLLDLGCGAGYSSVSFARRGAVCTAADLSPKMVEKAMTLADRHGVTIKGAVLNALHMPFPSDSFDVVYAANILHHVNPREAIAEIRRVLRPGGKACFIDPLRHNPVINVYRLMTKSNRTPDERPLDIAIVNTLRKNFNRVEYDTFWIISLWLFLRFYFFERRDPNRVHYWHRIRAEGKRLERQYLRLERFDNIVKKMPFMKRFAWNIVAIATK